MTQFAERSLQKFGKGADERRVFERMQKTVTASTYRLKICQHNECLMMQ